MPRTHTDNGRVELRLRPQDKAVLTRAASIERVDLTGFILRNVLPQAEAVIDQHFLSLAIAVVHRLDLRQRHV